MTLIVCSGLYFLRAPGISVYIFDVVWLLGLFLFPKYFLRMPWANYLAFAGFAIAIFLSIFYVVIDSRPLDVPQAIIILMRYMQMVICANFFCNCVRSGKLIPRDFFVSALIALLIPLWGGLVLYMVAPEMAVVFNRYSGYFGNPNVLALYIVVSTSVFYSLMRFQLVPSWLTYPLVLTFLATTVYSLMLSGSNSGILLFFIVTMIAFTGSWRVILRLSLAGGLAFLSLNVMEDTILKWAQELISSDFQGWRRTGWLIGAIYEGGDLEHLGSQSYRSEVKEYLFDQQFGDFWSILLGLGPGQSKLLIYTIEGLTVTIHNFYLLLFLEYGVLGTACFAGMALVTFHRFHWNYAALQIVSGFLLASLGTPMLYLPFFWVSFFAALAGLTQTHFLRPSIVACDLKADRQ